MGRGGPAEPRRRARRDGAGRAARRSTPAATHAASDYLEDAALAGVPTVGCRRVGGGLAGEPAESNVAEGAALAAVARARARSSSRARAPASRRWRSSGPCAWWGPGEPEPLGRVPAAAGRPRAGARGRRRRRAGALRFELRPEPAEPLPEGARVALFTTGAERCEGVEPVVSSANLARRGALAEDLDRAAARALRRLPHRAEGGGDRHGGAAGARRGRARGLPPQPPRRTSTRRSQACAEACGRGA